MSGDIDLNKTLAAIITNDNLEEISARYYILVLLPVVSTDVQRLPALHF
jgi:hypothetical protein